MQHHVERSNGLALHVAQRHGDGMHAEFVLAARIAPVLLAHPLDHVVQIVDLRDGLRRQARQFALLHPMLPFTMAFACEQHASGGCGMRRQARAQMQSIGRELVDIAGVAARDDHHFVVVQHDDGAGLTQLDGELIERGLHDFRQARGCEIAARKTQHARREPEVASIRLEIAQMCEREQVSARCCARESGALRGQRGVQSLALHVETFQHGQAFGDADDEVCRCDGHGSNPLRDQRAACAIIEQ